MKMIVLAVFKLCMAETIPNPFQVEHLPVEQKQVIYKYAQIKCAAETRTIDCLAHFKKTGDWPGVCNGI